jgi:hypothetical protein
MSNLTTARNALTALLATIAPVRTGRPALETTSAALPCIVLWSTGDAPTADQYYDAPAYTRSLTIEYQTLAGVAYDDDLDTVLRNLRLALHPVIGGTALTGALAVRETSARFFAPDLTQGGSRIAMLQLTLDIDYLEPVAT